VLLQKSSSEGSVVTHLRRGGIFSDSIITNVLLIKTVKRSLKIGQYLMKLRRKTKCASFWGATLYNLQIAKAS